jgi:hypothetical protein
MIRTALSLVSAIPALILATSIALAQGSSITAPPAVSGNTNVPTYGAALHNFSNSSAGDIFCISGSATKIVKVKAIHISAVASAAVVSTLSVARRSSLNTGGTPTVVTPVLSDTAVNPAATAVVTGYATAPTAGTLVGRVRAQKLSIPTATSTTFATTPATFDFARYWDQPQVLRGVTQALCVDVDGTAGGVWEIDAEFTEE